VEQGIAYLVTSVLVELQVLEQMPICYELSELMHTDTMERVSYAESGCCSLANMAGSVRIQGADGQAGLHPLTV